MFRKALLFGGLLLLGGAVVTPAFGQARGGGGHGGGFPNGGWGHNSWGHWRGGYGYYPYYYGGYDYSPSSSDYRSYYGGSAYDSNGPGAVTDDAGYRGSSRNEPPSYSYGSLSSGGSSYYAPATDSRARITVKVPADAWVTFDGTPTTATGLVREFTSPPLRPGIPYTYVVRAHWYHNGREDIQSQEVQVRPGAHIDVSFTGPSRAIGQAR